METAEMRRSTLQRKDREELTMIATTLGKKPPSRARKGEIIELILDLAAGGDGSSVGADADADADAAADETESAAPPTDEATVDEAAADDATGGTHKAATKAEKEAEKKADTNADKNADQNAEANNNEAKDAESNRPADTNNGGGETGNRKRRRRGRDRDDNKDSDERWDGEPIPVAGYLELRNEGYGFLRVDGALPSKDDAYVPVKMVRQFGLRKGDHLTGTSRPANRNEKNPAMIEIHSINGAEPPEGEVERIDFDALPVVYPSEPIVLAGDQEPADPTGAVIDIIAPLGRGQRALLAGPPKSGKTTILQHVIRSIEANHDDLELFVLLLDERPEDITEMVRWTEKGEVVAAAFDRPAEEQITIAEMVIERAKRRVEAGKDVVVIVDGVTRLARAYAQEASGRSGVTVDATTVHPAKRFLAAGRKLEGGGSLTLLATITVGTESAVDATIYEELAGTANCEIRLTRAAAVRRVFPAVDIAGSATIHEESLRDDDALAEVEAIRRELAAIAEDPDTEETADLQALLAKIADRLVKL